MKILSLSLLFGLIFLLTKAQPPALHVEDLSSGEQPVTLSELHIDVKIVGRLAVTTLDMLFYNPNDRIMEGELQFPLAEGQSVSRFALDIEGKLREGVVVEKAKGQQVFEDIIREKVDPGLLEMTVGNNFRTRVYPLPAKGFKRAVIAYDQELTNRNGRAFYDIPLDYKMKLKSFTFSVSVFDQEKMPVIRTNPWNNLSFTQLPNGTYTLDYKAENYQPSELFSFFISENSFKKQQPFIEKGKYGKQYVFYTQIQVPVMKTEKTLPQKLAIYWDASSSMSSGNMELEYQLLDTYFNKNKNVMVELHVFNCVSDEINTFSINDGNWKLLKNALQSVKYDGATEMIRFNNLKSKCNEIFLFSDGMFNFGKENFKSVKIPVTTINSLSKSNHSMLQYIASSTGGNYINLNKQTIPDALQTLCSDSYRFISTGFSQNDIVEIQPSFSQEVNADGNFTVSGLLKSNKATLALNFGKGNNIIYTEKIQLNTSNAKDYHNLVERIYAQRKIQELDIQYDKNKEQITDLGKKYNIVTRNTSLIVLDRIEDYVLHRITPPDELLDQYNEMIKSLEKVDRTEKNEKINDIYDDYLKERLNWWSGKEDDDDDKKENIFTRLFSWTKKKKQQNSTRNSYDTYSGYPSGSSYVDQLSGTFLPDAVNIVKGQIVDYKEEPIIGASVSIPGTSIGAISDIDGNFSITMPAGQNQLQFNYIGCSPVRATIHSTQLRVRMGEDNMVLSEVVTVAYSSTQKNEEAASYDDREIAESIAEMKENMQSENADTYIKLQEWDPDVPYLNQLKDKSKAEYYPTYLLLKNEYKDVPSFYLDVSAFFEKNGMKKEALLVLSNLIEMDIENYRLMRVLAHRLHQLGYIKKSIELFEAVLELRPQEPQSYRDLALVYQSDKQYQKAVDLFYKIITTDWDGRFDGIEVIAINEMNAAITEAKNNWKGINTKHIDKRLLKNMPVDIRIVLNWDTDNSDMDLWVVDPNDERCDYSNNRTEIGGLISDDFTDGYGPEEFLLKKAVKGKYEIFANYFGTREQDVIGPTTIYLEIYTYYASKKCKKEIVTLRLEQDKGEIKIGEIIFN